ncbi:L,D-transpeptidase [endosymbiont of unidentified scaly snail isolate Monju]|uniref:L,D-transpeptidase n=1 Tax=endosymbiont of unidentified scaly snail isolate Monju TaxID=1248727 RepID=UPI0003892D25|nr:L,D-transpeptidase [endosymbiont of unidentified scaly snail isolate Monju]BAN69078.1 ErfK/YbiS/YcfS/YnhG family protein [endosymbiont of unidentified scaly snail isolate Monju]
MTSRHIDIDLSTQTLRLLEGEQELVRYTVSTARNGAGQCQGSECTPLGRHRIRLKIGAGCPPGTVFVARRPTGEVWTSELARAHPERDWILTRILWLTGCEPGYNRGGECDSLRRFIYIHGTPDDQPMGEPCSHGCVRMRNTDIIELFDCVERGTEVLIHAGGAGGSC